MKIKDFLSNISENKSNGQLVTCLRKTELKKAGMSKEDFFNINVDVKLKKLLTED
jgi:hypothetical protein